MLLLTPDCGLCLRSADKRFGIELNARQMEHLVSQCQKAPKHETGGVLIGRYSRDLSMALVTEVTSAPVDSKHGATWFDRGVQGLSKKLQVSWKRTGTFYLGEWHFHPGAAPNPSSVDLAQLAAIAQSPLYACPEPVLLIVGGADRQWNPAAYVYEKGKKSHTLSTCKSEVLEGEQNGESSGSTPHG